MVVLGKTFYRGGIRGSFSKFGAVMKKLIAVRHAKSDWVDLSLKDYDRPLNDRGFRDAPLMGARILTQYGLPDLIMSSTALRAKQTAEAIAEACAYGSEKIVWHDNLYHAGPKVIQDRILETDDAVQTLLFVCHNPGITFFINSLCGPVTNDLPTCGVVVFEVEAEHWSDFAMASKRFVDFDYPKRKI
jgi:phosphohistidine phosphatase